MPGAKSFLLSFKPNATVATRLGDTTKGVVSTVSRTTNAALGAIGLSNDMLDFYGNPSLHPMGEEDYAQVAIRYGEYVAQLRVKPEPSALREVIGKKVEPQDENAL